jgi:hypothetical protein
MTPFPWLGLCLMFFSAWVALDKRFRSEDVARNWWIFRLNLIAAAVNGAGVLLWLFNWITA